MRNLLKMSVLTIAVILFLTAGIASAFTLGTEITISDENTSNSNSWYKNQEDQEVEPGMLQAQEWDLEGFFLNLTTLTMVGGYDFLNGVQSNNDVGENDYSNNKIFESGDIFIDINGDAVFGDIDGISNGNVTVHDTFGYDYVLDLDFSLLTYSIIALGENSSTMLTAYYKQNYGSNPWKYVSGGDVIGTGTIGYTTGLSDADVGFLGDKNGVASHYAAQFDLGFLGDDIKNMTVHFTMECGNDNLMGHAPEPATMFLLGSGLVGIAGLRRKFRKS